MYARAQEAFTQPMPMPYNWTLSERIFADELNAAYKGDKPPHDTGKSVPVSRSGAS